MGKGKSSGIFCAAVAALAGMTIVPSRAGAVLTVFTDRAAFRAAAGGPGVLETYDVPRTFTSGDNLYNGVNYRFPGTVGLNNVAGGNYNGDEFGTTSLDLIFPTPLRGFGADFVGAATTSGLSFTINGETVALRDSLPNPGTGFFGVVSSTPFTLVDVSGGANPNEIYDADNLEYVVIPEPTTAGLVMTGVLALSLRRRLPRGR